MKYHFRHRSCAALLAGLTSLALILGGCASGPKTGEAPASALYQAFSCVVTENGEVYWKAGVDTPDGVIQEFALPDDDRTVKLTIKPDNGEKYPYLYPNGPWKLTVAEETTPAWFSAESQKAAFDALEQWKATVYRFDLAAFMNPPDPSAIAPHEPTAEDIELFRAWIASGGNPRNMVMKSVGGALGATVANELWNYLNTEFWSGFMNRANVGSVVSRTSGLKNVGAVQEGQFAAYFGSFFAALTGGQGGSAHSGAMSGANGSANGAANGAGNSGANAGGGGAEPAGREGSMGGPGNGGPQQSGGGVVNGANSGANSGAQAGGYEYGAAVTLISHGFIVSSDATTWRLHNAADGSIAYSISAAEIAADRDQGFAVIVSKDGKTYWQAGVESGDKLMQLFNLAGDGNYMQASVVPDNNMAYPYLYPDLPWKLVVKAERPAWYSRTHEEAIMAAFEEWKAFVYDFDMEGFFYFFDHLQKEPVKPTASDIALLKEWAALNPDGKSANATPDANFPWVGQSIWSDAEQYLNDAFNQAYGQCPGPTVCHGIEASLKTTLDPAVEDLIGSSVGEKALVGSFFTNTAKWKGSEGSAYPYQVCAELWKRGFIASFDGTTWRLSSGKDGAVVYTITAKALAAR
ncbi:MAG: hypothetical protein LBG76_00415 [Treponema sp.]|jgi:hypothetical protein|nr:hypothetical protein [Treponema sp.]